jgi:hypothetical protein
MTTLIPRTTAERALILALAQFTLAFALATPTLAKGSSVGAVQAACKRTPSCMMGVDKKGNGSGCTDNVCSLAATDGACHEVAQGRRRSLAEHWNASARDSQLRPNESPDHASANDRFSASSLRARVLRPAPVTPIETCSLVALSARAPA